MLTEQTGSAEAWVAAVRALSASGALRGTAEWAAAWAAQERIAAGGGAIQAPRTMRLDLSGPRARKRLAFPSQAL
jgi:hypothetical protein